MPGLMLSRARASILHKITPPPKIECFLCSNLNQGLLSNTGVPCFHREPWSLMPGVIASLHGPSGFGFGLKPLIHMDHEDSQPLVPELVYGDPS